VRCARDTGQEISRVEAWQRCPEVKGELTAQVVVTGGLDVKYNLASPLWPYLVISPPRH